MSVTCIIWPGFALMRVTLNFIWSLATMTMSFAGAGAANEPEIAMEAKTNAVVKYLAFVGKFVDGRGEHAGAGVHIV